MSDIVEQNGVIRRAKSEQKAEMKKGRPSWQPASLNVLNDKEDGYRYRLIRKDPDNIARKKREGWEILSGLSGSKTTHESAGRINDASQMTSVVEGNDWVAGRIKEDVAQERDAYFNNESERRVSGLTAHLKRDLARDGAQMHGNVSISSKRGTEVIE